MGGELYWMMTLTLPVVGMSGETFDLCANKRLGTKARIASSLYFRIKAFFLRSTPYRRNPAVRLANPKLKETNQYQYRPGNASDLVAGFHPYCYHRVEMVIT